MATIPEEVSIMALVQHTSLGFARQRSSADAKNDPGHREHRSDGKRDGYEDSGYNKRDA